MTLEKKEAAPSEESRLVSAGNCKILLRNYPSHRLVTEQSSNDIPIETGNPYATRITADKSPSRFG